MSHLEPEAKIFCLFAVSGENSKGIRNPIRKITMSKYSDGEFQPSYEVY
jgi:ribose-phosphate pyrophosphokinase